MYMYLQSELVVQLLTLCIDICKINYSSGGGTRSGPRFETEAAFTCDIITLTFDLSTSKWGHASTFS